MQQLRVVPPPDGLPAAAADDTLPIEMPACPTCSILRTERDLLQILLDIANEDIERLTKAVVRESHHMDQRAPHSGK